MNECLYQAAVAAMNLVPQPVNQQETVEVWRALRAGIQDATGCFGAMKGILLVHLSLSPQL